MSTSVLALDLATTTGWAWHRVGMPRPFFGAFKLPGKPDEIGLTAAALEKWLFEFNADLSEDSKLTHIFFEAQHISSKVNMQTAYRLIGLGATVEKCAWQIPTVKDRVYKVEIQTWRKHFLGRGAGFKRTEDKKAYLPGEDPKEIALQRAAHYGWHIDVADAAEACGILDYSLTCIGDAHPRPWRDEAMMKGTHL